MRRRLALGAAALLVAAGLAEVALSALDWPRFDACDTRSDYAVGDPELGFRGDPSLPVAGVTPNRLGLRGPVPEIPKPEGELRLLFLGDSTCWGLGVALEQSFGARVATKLGPHGSYQLGAFPSYSSYHSAVLLDRLLSYAPDRVVLYVGARNDGDRARYYPDAEIPARRARLESAWHRVRVLRTLEGGVDRIRMLLRRLRGREEQARVPPARFRENIERILARVHAAGASALVVLPPVSSAFEAEHPLVRRYREILVEIAAAHAVPTVSVDAAFAAHESGEPLFFPDGFHLSAAGHRVVAEAVYAALRSRAEPEDSAP